MWRDLIIALDLDATLHPAATQEQLATLERNLGVTLPQELSDLLRETNGAEVVQGVGLVWSTEEIARRNAQMRQESRAGEALGSFMPVDHLLYFGDAGNGDLFAFPITSEGVRGDVFLWDHEDDSRMCKAPSLRRWLTRTN